MLKLETESYSPPQSSENFFKENPLICCPICKTSFKPLTEGAKTSAQCESGHLYPIDASGIPLLYIPNEWDASKKDITLEMRAFYEDAPFPNYDDIDSIFSLKLKAEKALVFSLLNRQIPPNARVLEVGAGTSQLSNYLASTFSREVTAADLCLNSLKLGKGFAARNEIDRVRFVQMNLFKPAFQEGYFDIVISNRVLHHTSDPYLAFQSISKLVRPGGYILIGLYNTYGRLWTDFRRFLFRMGGRSLSFLDFRLKNKKIGDPQKRSEYLDQYFNSHESKHTYGEVARWFEKNSFKFVHSVPRPLAFDPIQQNERLFEPIELGNPLDHLITQFGMLGESGEEDGVFVFIGKKIDARQKQ